MFIYVRACKIKNHTKTTRLSIICFFCAYWREKEECRSHPVLWGRFVLSQIIMLSTPPLHSMCVFVLDLETARKQHQLRKAAISRFYGILCREEHDSRLFNKQIFSGFVVRVRECPNNGMGFASLFWCKITLELVESCLYANDTHKI